MDGDRTWLVRSTWAMKLSGRVHAVQFPVMHRLHLKIFGTLFPPEFKNQHGDPYLWSIYRHQGAAVFAELPAQLVNSVGGSAQARYSKTFGSRVVWSDRVLTDAIGTLERWLGKHAPAAQRFTCMDVVVPTYRCELQALEAAAVLGAASGRPDRSGCGGQPQGTKPCCYSGRPLLCGAPRGARVRLARQRRRPHCSQHRPRSELGGLRCPAGRRRAALCISHSCVSRRNGALPERRWLCWAHAAAPSGARSCSTHCRRAACAISMALQPRCPSCHGPSLPTCACALAQTAPSGALQSLVEIPLALADDMYLRSRYHLQAHLGSARRCQI